MANDVEILIKAIDEASATLDKIKRGAGDMGTGVKAGTDKAADGAKGLSKSMNEAVQGVTGLNLASLSAVGAVMALGAALLEAVGEAGEAQVAQVKLNTVLAATGGQAGMTADAINDMATRLMFLTGIDDDVIVSASAMALTFKNITAETFPDFMEAAVNMSSFLGRDLTQTVQLLGRAMDTGGESLSSLSRQGVVLSDSVQESIRSLYEQGKITEANTALIDELNARYGEAAENIGNTYPGQVKKLQTAFSELKETVGGTLLPVLTDAVVGLNTLMTSEAKMAMALKDHNATMLKTARSYDEYVDEMVRAMRVAGMAVDDHGRLTVTIMDEMGAVKEVSGALQVATEEQYLHNQEVERFQMLAANTAPIIAQMAQGYTMSAAEAAELSARMNDAQLMAMNTPEAFNAAIAANNEAARAADTAALANANLAESLKGATNAEIAKAAIDSLGQSLTNGKISADDYAVAVRETQLAFGLADERSLLLTDGLSKLTGMVTAGQIPVENYSKALDWFVGGVRDGSIHAGNLNEKLGDMPEDIKPAQKALEEFNGHVQFLANELSKAKVYLADIALYDGKEFNVSVNINSGGGGGGGGGACFTAETPVDTLLGPRPIRTVRAGSKVMAYDPETGQVFASRVARTLHDIRYDVVTVTTERGSYHCSPNHRWLTTEGWVEAAHLMRTDTILHRDGTAEVLEVRPYPGEYKVYNLEIEHQAHTYLVDGHVVHNAKMFASGGSFTVGGSGGTDSTDVAFRATPGEQVDVRTPGQASKEEELMVQIDRMIRELPGQIASAVAQAVA